MHRALALLAGLIATTALAAYPDRPIRFVVPVVPGGAVDTVGRIVGLKLAPVLGQNVVVDNRGGANYIIGSETVARAAPDGYTLLFTAGAHTINPSIYRKLPYDTVRDFTPIAYVANSTGLVIAVHPSFQAKTLQDLIGLAKATPGKINYASGGVGNLTHLAGALFEVRAGVKLTHVPYKSAGPAINDLLAGHVPLMFGPSPVLVPMVQQGRLRALAFTALKRSPQLPDVPTVDELGIKGYEASGWYGIHGPRAMAREVVGRINEAAARVVRMPDVLERYAALNLEPVSMSPEDFARFIQDDIRKYAEIVQRAGITPQ
jgi:tripartite-type tricarboxylate transporter receptor subunit TctC